MIAEILLVILLTILLLVAVAAISFWAGTTWTRTRALPTIMASMSDEELDELADQTRVERRRLGVDTD